MHLSWPLLFGVIAFSFILIPSVVFCIHMTRRKQKAIAHH